MADDQTAIQRVVKAISYASLALFVYMAASGLMKISGLFYPKHYARQLLQFRQYHALLQRAGMPASFDDTSLRVLYGMAQIFSGTMLLSRLDAQATYACCVLNVLEVFARSVLRQSIWSPAIVLWVVFTLLILRRELKRLLGLRGGAAKGKSETTPATGSKRKAS
ncbi:hypothetical protein NDN08_004223 [Rhodosorus marinus]|uniref:Uncharacterized protein n=1 Tax=Rhodosorus marinus TaxID=101924 RepID=A0AAV8ULA8_9RHOD|nr:hypothetical protein NDN08_004223 [Rhodosorus marinus]